MAESEGRGEDLRPGTRRGVVTKISAIWQNTAISSMATALQGVANLVTVIYLARILAPLHYGIFSYTWAISGMVGILTYLGIKPLLTRDLSRSGDPTQVVGYGLSLTALVSLIVAAGLVLGSLVMPGLVGYRDLFILWALFVFFNGVTPRWVYSGIQRLWMVSLGDLAGALVRLGLTVLWVHGPEDLGLAVGITVLSVALPVVGEVLWLRRLVPFRCQRISRREGFKTIRAGLPLAITSFVSILYSGVDTWILHVYAGSRAVGYYAAAYRPIVFLNTFSAVYFNLTFPLMSRLTVHDRPTAESVVQLAGISILALVIPIGVGIDVVAGPVMRQALGSRYAASGPVLAVLIWSWCLALYRDIFSTTLMAGNQEARFARLFALVGGANLILMGGLVHWRAMGIAVALVTTQGLLLGGTLRSVRRIVRSPVDWAHHRASFLKIVGNSLAMGAIVWWVKASVPVEVAIALGIIVYGLLTWLTRAVPWPEVLAISRRPPSS